MTATAVRERPILFTGEMVRAIIDGRKTVTRRPVTPQAWSYASDAIRCPYGAPGECRLWVRETWGEDYPTRALVTVGQEQQFIPRASGVYRADGHMMSDAGTGWRPSIFMPRRACRLVLEVVSVRVERLQAITTDDVRAEGIEGHPSTFAAGWDRLYRAKPELQWAADPYVWRVEFAVAEAPAWTPARVGGP